METFGLSSAEWKSVEYIAIGVGFVILAIYYKSIKDSLWTWFYRARQTVSRQ